MKVWPNGAGVPLPPSWHPGPTPSAQLMGCAHQGSSLRGIGRFQPFARAASGACARRERYCLTRRSACGDDGALRRPRPDLWHTEHLLGLGGNPKRRKDYRSDTARRIFLHGVGIMPDLRPQGPPDGTPVRFRAPRQTSPGTSHRSAGPPSGGPDPGIVLSRTSTMAQPAVPW